MFDVAIPQEDKIETLKRSSRLIHYCAAPLLFHPNWRQKRSASALESAAASPHEPCTEQKEEETKGKDSKGQKKSEGESRKGIVFSIMNRNNTNSTTKGSDE